jgi:RNA polymerase primary sigma factor
VELIDLDLRQLISTGREQGFLTYEQVGKYLPDEANSSEKLDNLLVTLERKGIKLLDKAPANAKLRTDQFNVVFADGESASVEGESPDADFGDENLVDFSAEAAKPTRRSMAKLSDDPIRLYLSQMSSIPLFSREEEIALAKKIEITRKRFRRSLLANDFALRQTVEILTRVHQGTN